MKNTLVGILVHLLSYLVPLEDAISLLVKKAAATKAAKEADMAIRATDSAALRIVNSAIERAEMIQNHAREEHAQRVAYVKASAHVVTPEGAAALVARVAPTPSLPQAVPQGV
jgi:hypothetical protein